MERSLYLLQAWNVFLYVLGGLAVAGICFCVAQAISNVVLWAQTQFLVSLAATYGVDGVREYLEDMGYVQSDVYQGRYFHPKHDSWYQFREEPGDPNTVVVVLYDGFAERWRLTRTVRA